MSRRLNWNYLPDVYDVDSNLSDLIASVNDPYDNVSHTELEYSHSTDSVVAGVAERLGLPQGLSFDDVFNRIC